MATFNAVTSNQRVSGTDSLTLYTCPSDKSHAVVDIKFFRPTGSSGNSVFSLAITTNSLSSLSEFDYFFTRAITLTDDGEVFFVGKVVVGRNETVYINNSSGTVNVRLEGIEESNSLILQAGKLSGKVLATSGYTNVFKTNFASTAVVSVASVSVRNANISTSAAVGVYITNSASPDVSDHVTDLVIEPGGYAFLANTVMKPNETLFLKTLTSEVYANVNGLTQS